MKKFLKILLLSVVLFSLVYIAIVYFVSYSKGVRSGELIKISHKGIIFKTWEGELSQGISGAQIFKFSVESNQKDVLKKLEEYQGHYVKVNYKERVSTLFWLGDTKYFITDVKKEASPHKNN